MSVTLLKVWARTATITFILLGELNDFRPDRCEGRA